MYVGMYVSIYLSMNIYPSKTYLHVSTTITLTYFFLVLYIWSYIGKSILLEYIAKYAIQNGHNICISAPAGKLAAWYASRLPECRCSTVHSNFFVPVNNEEQLRINWNLADVHILIVDEVYWFFGITLSCIIQFSFKLHYVYFMINCDTIITGVHIIVFCSHLKLFLYFFYDLILSTIIKSVSNILLLLHS